MTICSRCIFTDRTPNIRFNAEGVCHYCRGVKIISPIGIDKLIYKIKSVTTYARSDYDCLIPISGGLDSSYVLYYAVKILKLTCLALHVDMFTSDLAYNNIHNICNILNVDLKTIKIDCDLVSKLIKTSLEFGHLLTPAHVRGVGALSRVRPPRRARRAAVGRGGRSRRGSAGQRPRLGQAGLKGPVLVALLGKIGQASPQPIVHHDVRGQHDLVASTAWGTHRRCRCRAPSSPRPPQGSLRCQVPSRRTMRRPDHRRSAGRSPSPFVTVPRCARRGRGQWTSVCGLPLDLRQRLEPNLGEAFGKQGQPGGDGRAVGELVI